MYFHVISMVTSVFSPMNLKGNMSHRISMVIENAANKLCLFITINQDKHYIPILTYINHECNSYIYVYIYIETNNIVRVAADYALTVFQPDKLSIILLMYTN